MALIFPQVNSNDIPYDSERLVYVALRDELPREYVVVHSYPWLRPDRDGTLREGETDFVVLHQHKGILVLEVKGGELEYRNASWLRKQGRGWKTITDPFVQARRNMHALLGDIETRSALDVRKTDFRYGYAVVFPHHDYSGQLPPGTDEAIVIRQPDMGSITQAIERAFASWPARDRGLDSRKWNKLINSVLPSFKLFRPLGGESRDVLDSIWRLTDEQLGAFQGLYEDNPRVFVRGVAGSGKTILALDRARTFAESGLHTLLVCFNRQLAEELSDRVAGSNCEGDAQPRLQIRHFHGLARDLITAAQLDFTVPSGSAEARRFWEQDVPDLMEQAVMVLLDDDDPQFEAIVIDEGQDFHRRWWECLQFSLLTDPDGGPIYAFADPDQSLWEWSIEEPPIHFNVRYRLTRNCRNTQVIARSSASLAKVDTQVFDRAPKGRHLKVLEPVSSESVKGILLAEVRRLLCDEHLAPSDLVLVGACNWRNGTLATLQELAGVPLTDSAREWRKGKSLLVTTSRSFKGLEAPVVILYDVYALSTTFSRTDLYVAMTRAQSQCILMIGDRQLAEEIKTAVSQAVDTTAGSA